MKKDYQIRILNERRLKLNENLEGYYQEKDRLSRRVEMNKNMINSIESELVAIDQELHNKINLKNIDVKLRIVNEFVPNKHKRLLLEIKIKGITEPICKLLTLFEIEQLNKAKSNTNKFIFYSKMKKIASDYIMVHGISNEKNSVEIKSKDVFEKYINDYNVDHRLERIRFFQIN